MKDNNTYIMNQIGQRISDVLERSGLRQKDLAGKIGVTESAMSRYIKGDRVPRTATMAQIATALCVSADYLMCGPQDEKNGK